MVINIMKKIYVYPDLKKEIEKSMKNRSKKSYR